MNSPPRSGSALPIDGILPAIAESLRRSPSLVIEAPPGAGKTTRVPPALLSLVPGEIWVLEPRRIAARRAARRVAAELGQPLGETIGYQVRFDQAAGPKTRIRFVTEGILTRRLASDPSLRGISAVVLDEFHERHLEGDFALALLKRLQRIRAGLSQPGLHLIVMSATLDAAPVARFLDGCPILRSEGRAFATDIRHLPYSPAPLEAQIRTALATLLAEGLTGDVLVFLPGAAEIRRAARECHSLGRDLLSDLLILPLHGSLTPEEQDRALAPAAQRKVILSTNLAESSVTVEGVTTVIDSGLARIASWSPWSGLQTLHVTRISKASAKQRAGRAGRTAPGRVLRTYTVEDYQLRPEHDTPEILRGDLSQLCLALRAMRIAPANLDWLDAPPEPALRAAESLLDRLGAGPTSQQPDTSQQLAQFPLPPRLARMLLEAAARGVPDDACTAAALLASGWDAGSNDLLTALDRLNRLPNAAALRQHAAQLRRILRQPPQQRRDEDALLQSVLTAFPDRVARLRSGNQLLLSTGASAEIAGTPPPWSFLVALDAEDRSDQPLPLVRIAARIEPEWLLDLFPEHVREETRLSWNRPAERVEASSLLLYDRLVLEESRIAPDPEQAAALLAQKALEAGPERFADRFLDAALWNRFLGRLAFAGIDSPDLDEALRELCFGLQSFSDLKSAASGLIPLLEQRIGARRLDQLAPASIRLAAGRQTPIHYEPGQSPWIASRLQDFFGMKETPRIGPRSTPLVIHLLAPSHRPVQTTTDLAGFWERLYPQVRRELMRRYPKHAWPERP